MNAEKIHRLTVQKLPIYAEARLSDMPGLARSLEPMVEDTLQGLIVRIRGFVLAEQHEPKTYEIKRWASLWDHAKSEIFPDWLKRRFPPQETVEYFVQPITVKICPHVQVDTPKDYFIYLGVHP